MGRDGWRGGAPGSGPRSGAERDAMTVEIGYAFVGGCVLAALTFALFAVPVAVWTPPARVETALLGAGGIAAGAVAVTFAVRVLRRFRADRTERELQRLLAGDD